MEQLDPYVWPRRLTVVNNSVEEERPTQVGHQWGPRSHVGFFLVAQAFTKDFNFAQYLNYDYLFKRMS